MSKSLHILILISSIIELCSNKLLDTKLMSLYYTERIKVYAGNTFQVAQSSIDLTAPISWFFKKQFNNYSYDDTHVLQPNLNVKIGRYSEAILGDYIEDVFYLDGNENNTIKYSFLLLYEIPPDYHGNRGVLSLAFKHENENNSIVHIYKSKGLIDKLAFGLKRDTKNRLLRLGGLDEEDTFNKTHSYFDVIGKDGRWDCIVTKAMIQFGPDKDLFITTNDNNYAYLDTMDEIILVPTAFFDMLMAHYKKAIETKLCELYTFQNKKRQLTCLNLHTLRIGSITIEINSFQYILQISDLWICETEDDCEFIVEDDPAYNQWKFGTYFYFKKNLLFDYEEKKVHLYSNKTTNDVKHIDELTSNQIIKGNSLIYLIVFASVLLGCGVILMAISKYLFKNGI